MSMALNIRNSEVRKLVTELARRRKVSLTQAVLDAVRHELEREKSRNRRSDLADQLLAIGKRCAAHMTEPTSSAVHEDLLYDSRGQPR